MGKAQATMLEYIASKAREGDHGDAADLVALINALGAYNEKHAAGSNGTKSKVAVLVSSLGMITALVCFLGVKLLTVSETQSGMVANQAALVADVAFLKVELTKCQKLNP
jgi:hypothetical protein